MKFRVTIGNVIGVALCMGSALGQQEVTGSEQFCIQSPTGPIKCEYQTMAQCEDKRPSNENDRCITRSQAKNTDEVPTSGKREQAPSPGEQKD
jgi:hypothetical protein